MVVDILAGLSPTTFSKKGTEPETFLPTDNSDLEKPCRDVELLMKELEEYQPGLSGRVMIVVANKADLSTRSPELEQLTKLRLKLLEDYLRIFRERQIEKGSCQEIRKIEVVVMSAKHRQNIHKLVTLLKSVATPQT